MTAEPGVYARYVTIVTYSSFADARIAQSALESFGIDAHVEFASSYSAALGGVKLLVPGDDSIWALHYLQKTAQPVDESFYETDDDECEDECPHCASDRVYPIARRRRMGAIIGFSLISVPMSFVAMLFAPLRDLLFTRNECKACGRRW